LSGAVSAVGNLLTGSYAYDGENRIISAPGVSFDYDAEGRRVKKSDGTLYWYGAGGDVLQETGLSQTPTSEYVFFGGKRVSRRDAAGNLYFYLDDHLGTTRQIVQSNGTPCYDADYDPYGRELGVYVNNCPQNYKFTGKERDTETGLDYFGARYYGSNMGRWMSPDWSGGASAVPYADFSDPQSLNLYGYVRNNPLSKTDPDGHNLLDWFVNKIKGNPPPPPPPPVQPKPKPPVFIKYQKGTPAMSSRTERYVQNKLNATDVTTVNISYTTNGEHSSNSLHYEENGARAVDINKVDNQRVDSSAKNPEVMSKVSEIQNSFNSNDRGGAAHENFGPSGLYKDGQQFENSTLQAQHDGHIHEATPNED
jgi:RHS repeat-associated protein